MGIVLRREKRELDLTATYAWRPTSEMRRWGTLSAIVSRTTGRRRGLRGFDHAGRRNALSAALAGAGRIGQSDVRVAVTAA